MDLVNKRYLLKKAPAGVEKKLDSYNLYRYLSDAEDVCIKEHYDNGKCTMVYLCFRGVPATLGTVREEEIKSMIDPARWEVTLRENVYYYEIEDGTVFVTECDGVPAYISRITLKDGTLKDYVLESGFKYVEVEPDAVVKEHNIWREKMEEVQENEVRSVESIRQ